MPQMEDSLREEELQQKRLKMHGEEKSWFELYLDIRNELTTRIFKLQEQVKLLENKHGRVE